jgi:hypothetical protein
MKKKLFFSKKMKNQTAGKADLTTSIRENSFRKRLFQSGVELVDSRSAALLFGPLILRVCLRIRSSIPNGIVRIFFTIKNEHIVLLHSIIKKTQKIPQQELDIARKRLKAWED